MRHTLTRLAVGFVAAVAMGGCGDDDGGGGDDSHSQQFAIDPRVVAAADFDGDGKIDLAAVDALNDLVTVVRNTTPQGVTTVTFATGVDLTTGDHPTGAGTGDFDSDGRADLVILNRSDVSFSVFLNTAPTNTATVSFAPRADFATPPAMEGITVTDFNGDGALDVILQSATVTAIFLNTTAQPGTVTFAEFDFATGASSTSGYVGVGAIVASDIDGSGLPDLVIAIPEMDDASAAGGIVYRLNTTVTGSATPTVGPVVYVTTGTPTALTAGNLNDDGKPDIAAGFERIMVDGSAPVFLVVLMNSTTPGNVSFAAGPETQGGQFFAVAMADLDDDGSLDVVTGDGPIPVFINATPPANPIASLDPAIELLPGGTRIPMRIATVDLNGDNVPEVVVPREDPAIIEVFFFP